MDPRPRIALLIDADNSSAKKLDLVLSELSTLGETSIRRAYGNWTKPGLRPWTEILHANAIQPMQQFDYSRGKNASDMAMVVDAMALLYNDHPDAFGIVSSDADFTPLVLHLRSKGAQVYGFGEAKTPEPFQTACTRFLLLDQLADPAEEVAEPVEPSAAPSQAAAAKKAPATATTSATKKTAAKKAAAPERKNPTELKQDTRLMTLLRTAVENAADDDGWAQVSTVGQRISNQSSFDSRNHGFSSLSKLLKAIDLFELKDEGKPSLAVRDKRRSKG